CQRQHEALEFPKHFFPLEICGRRREAGVLRLQAKAPAEGEAVHCASFGCATEQPSNALPPTISPSLSVSIRVYWTLSGREALEGLKVVVFPGRPKGEPTPLG